MAKKNIPEIYNRAYFLSDSVEGYQEFKDGSLSHIKMKLFDMLELRPGMGCLEVGIGRGEFLRYCAGEGVQVTGIDYSEDAINIARETMREFPEANIQVADARNLPFDDNCFERVFSGDVIEHLSRPDGISMLKEMYRVLRPGGFMLVHTAPNTVFTKFVFPLAKHILKLFSKETVEAVDSHMKVGSEYHVNEYNLFSLKNTARKAGLAKAQVWIDKDILRSGKHRLTQTLNRNPLMRLVGYCGKSSVVSFWMGNDLYLKCVKRGQDSRS